MCLQRRNNFNPRSRVGNDEAADGTILNLMQFQSTFPRGERQTYRFRIATISWISIHVPAWGTTCLKKLKMPIVTYFNPRSRVGNDEEYGGIVDKVKVFQSTFPRGERQTCSSISQLLRSISIHVPAWGTTGHEAAVRQMQSSFQSTFPRGERHGGSVMSTNNNKFQSTFPRGERPS